MCHRIHEESATTAIIHDNARVQENYTMYCKFWPETDSETDKSFLYKI